MKKQLLEGKNAVITGCLKGIGLETLKVFAKNGANVWACCQGEDAQFSEFIKKISEEAGVWIKPIYFDLADEASVKTGANQIISDKAPIDALINIAGVTHNALFQMTPISVMRQIFELNFFAQMLITQRLVKVMQKQKNGCVVNISSITAIDGNSGQVAYAASKAALIGATKTLARELGGDGVRVNCIAPGVINTDMTRGLSSENLDKLLAKVPAHKIGEPQDVAQVIAFLASDMASHITGQIIRVDGGI